MCEATSTEREVQIDPLAEAARQLRVDHAEMFAALRTECEERLLLISGRYEAAMRAMRTEHTAQMQSAEKTIEESRDAVTAVRQLRASLEAAEAARAAAEAREERMRRQRDDALARLAAMRKRLWRFGDDADVQAEDALVERLRADKEASDKFTKGT
jgi:hypothetical protein